MNRRGFLGSIAAAVGAGLVKPTATPELAPLLNEAVEWPNPHTPKLGERMTVAHNGELHEGTVVGIALDAGDKGDSINVQMITGDLMRSHGDIVELQAGGRIQPGDFLHASSSGRVISFKMKA